MFHIHIIFCLHAYIFYIFLIFLNDFKIDFSLGKWPPHMPMLVSERGSGGGHNVWITGISIFLPISLSGKIMMPTWKKGSVMNIATERVNEIKYLGVVIDRKLKWNKQREELQKKNRKLNYLMYHLWDMLMKSGKGLQKFTLKYYEVLQRATVRSIYNPEKFHLKKNCGHI